MDSVPQHLLVVCLLVFGVAACDTGIEGARFENQPPRTELSVRDTSLVENLAGAERLSSTVFASWSGTDPDGYVEAFELRYYNRDEAPSPGDGWIRTTRNDTLILLPIPRGERIADVVFEVRAIDNEGVTDPQPARTVFPIQNAPPTIRFSTFDLPPDTTFTIFSFAWEADDPEGPGNLDRIEVSFNDSTRYVPLPVSIDFVTFVGAIDRDDPGQTVAEAQVFAGLAFQQTGITVPGLRLDADNTIYIRAVDRTDTTSVPQRFTWHVRKPRGSVLYVNDYRKASWPLVQQYHLDLLREYLPAGTEIDTWNLSMPFTTGSAGNVPRSEALPPHADPTLRQMLALYDYIYWVSTNTTNSVRGNNLPFAAGVLDLFFEQGGKMMVHAPVIAPEDPTEILGNPAILLLPLTDVTVLPDSVRRLQLPVGSPITPVQSLPGVSEPLPALQSNRFFISELPFVSEGSSIPLYEAAYEYRSQSGSTGRWPGAGTIASISSDQRIGFFALPLLDDRTGAAWVVGADGDPDAPRRAVKLMLESLGFPRQ